MTTLKTKHEVFAKNDLKTKTVDCKKYWGCDVIVSALSIKDQLRMSELMKDDKPQAYLACYAVIFGVIDDQGKKIFNEDDLDQLLEKDYKCINKLANEIAELNNATEDYVKKKQEK